MDLSPENFERLMNWLHPNREEAGREYERIRALLIKHFRSQDCTYPEKLADATIDRVARILTSEQIEEWVGEKAKFFYRVGYYILREDRDQGLAEMQIPDGFEAQEPDREKELEPRARCLEKCLGGMPSEKRELIIRYYRGTKADKIRNRKQLARDLNMSLPRLRVETLRIRRELKRCIQSCLREVVR